MKIVETHKLKQGEFSPDQMAIYNGLDCALTYEILGELLRMRNTEPPAYAFSRALQAPVLEMMLRGFRIDEYERRKAITHIEGEIKTVNDWLQRMAMTVWGKPLNPRSPPQLKSFFYGAMKIPEQWTSQKGVRKLSMNRETLEKLEIYFYARPIIAAILLIRDLSKQLEVLETEVDSDGRMRTSYNIGGTETFRFSSSESAWATGTNIQNIQKDPDNPDISRRLSLRRLFIADEGWKICGIDLEQAESREVGFTCGVLFNDWSYLDACEQGDLHTTTCKFIWRSLPWTGDRSGDRKIAERKFYRDFSYRDMSKRGGHGSNYYGTPFTMSRHLKVPVGMMKSFQESYFDAFPGIPKWHRWIAQQLQTTQYIENAFGIGRHFFGRPNDDTTLREAIAFGPQSSTAMRLNLGLWRIWRYMPEVRILAQVHDALYFQYRVEDGEADIIQRALQYVRVTLKHKDRTFTIPGDAKCGWNWGNAWKGNPDGLIKWKGEDRRKRTNNWNQII